MRVPLQHVLERQHLEPHALDLLDPLHPSHHDTVLVQPLQASHLVHRRLFSQRRSNSLRIDSGMPVSEDRGFASVQDLDHSRLLV